MSKAYTETHWAIMGEWNSRQGRTNKPFFYYGTFPTRERAIERHTRDKGQSWADCREKGDRAVKVTVAATTKPEGGNG